ncbi:G-protein coupled receptor moody-like [Centruroides vittatus]|uniref:G-protein coupled receptor moody-like n=1 Tax=Centruroides vittatus TaxID=120091 RepID=UPI00350F644B
MSYKQVSNDNYNFTNPTIISLFDTHPPELLYFAAACCIFFVVIGVLGNIITIIALLKSRRLRNATSAFIINLCTADGLYCVFTIPLVTSIFIYRTWTYHGFLCMIYPLIRYSNSIVSVLTIIAITINRYIIIVYPKSYSKFYSKISVSIIIACIWLVSFLVWMPTGLGVWRKFEFNSEIGTCTTIDVNGKSFRNFLFIITIGILAFPTLVIAFCYSKILWIVRKFQKNLRYGQQPMSKKDKILCNNLNCFQVNRETLEIEVKLKSSSDLKLLKMIIVIYLTFLFCYIPLLSVNFFKEHKNPPVLNIIYSIGYFLAGYINPIIYALMDTEYRKAYKDLFSCNKTTNTNSETIVTRL